MKKKMRCKSCGFVIEEGKLGDVCPACGVPRKLFEPFEDNISEKRRAILKLALHPILVHFPIAFSVTLIMAALAAWWIIPWRDVLGNVIYVLALATPFTLVLAIAAGLLDGKTRFRKLTTPILKQKLFLGIFYFILSLAMVIVTLNPAWPNAGLLIIVVILDAGCLAFSTRLGLLGTSLMEAKFPGK